MTWRLEVELKGKRYVGFPLHHMPENSRWLVYRLTWDKAMTKTTTEATVAPVTPEEALRRKQLFIFWLYALGTPAILATLNSLGHNELLFGFYHPEDNWIIAYLQFFKLLVAMSAMAVLGLAGAFVLLVFFGGGPSWR